MMFLADDEEAVVYNQIKAALAHSPAQLDRGEGFTVAESKARATETILRSRPSKKLSEKPKRSEPARRCGR